MKNEKFFFKHSNVLKAGISNYHIVTAFKSWFIKGNPKVRHNHDYKNSDTEAFKQDLYKILKQTEMTGYTYIQNVFTWLFNKHALPKKNDAITKSISDHF